jgi:transcriptional regulator with XRE-family HTH domain
MQNILVMEWIENLKKIMSDQKVNIEKLKDKIKAKGQDLSRNSISNILNGNNNPKIETLQLIAEALGVEVSEIFKPSQPGQNALNGFVEFNGTVHRIQSVGDLESLLAKLKVTKE